MEDDYSDNSSDSGSVILDDAENDLIEEESISESVLEENLENKPLIDRLEHIDKKLKEIQFIRPQYQDVTPSFADEVPFLVDGDSLMVTVMKDNSWSDQLGGSSLHLVYLFERYLNIFVQRGGTFHLVFFQCWRNVWKENWNILLHRLILMKHFSKNTEQYQVYLFNSCYDPEFFELVSTLRPGFILTNLGVYEDCSQFQNIDINCLKHISNIQILNWLNIDLPCIDTKYIEVDISIVSGFYLDSNPFAKMTMDLFGQTFKRFMAELPKIEDHLDANFISHVEKYDVKTATYLTAGVLYSKEFKDTEFIKICLLTAAMMDCLEIKNRCCPTFTESLPELDSFVTNWNKCMYFSLSQLGDTDCAWNAVSDLWQGLLFGHVCRFTCSRIESAEQLGAGVASVYQTFIKDLSTLGCTLDAYPIEFSNLNLTWETNAILNVIPEPGALLPIQNPLVLEFVGNTLYDLKWCEPPSELHPIREYSEIHHYHSMKVINDEHEYIKDTYERMPDDPWERKKYQRNMNRHARYMTVYGSSIEGRPLENRAIIRNNKDKEVKNEKKQKTSKKAQEIIDQNMKKKASVFEKKEKEDLVKLEACLKKSDTNLQSLLKEVNLVISKFRKDSPFHLDVLALKLKILLLQVKNKAGSKLTNLKEIKKEIFLTTRLALSTCEVSKMSAKYQELMAKCLTTVDCNEIAKRNKLPVDKETTSSDAWIRYQLEQLGPDLIRETGGTPDPRVSDFIPDPWQRELFDIVDKRQSAVIVAPTSSGKTYASYYCMESVLREGTEGIVVYVSPTKALVNQVAATVYARFKDTVMPPGKSIYGIFTRDYRTHALNSQILITVPQCLEILLMSPRRYSWVQNLKYVIFDEVHCITGNMGGVAWERCLLLIRCPFLALSATIRHPEQLHSWLQQAEYYKRDRDSQDECLRKNSYKVHLVVHSERHSDLTKFTYGNGQLHHLHPYANLEQSVMKLHDGIPRHIIMSPAETIELYDAMASACSHSSELKELAPENFFSKSPENGFITRNLVKNYENQLSKLLTEWFENHKNDFEKTINLLKPVDIDKIVGTGKMYVREKIVEFLATLQRQNMLPAIVFAYDRALVHEMMQIATRYYMKNVEVLNRRDEKQNQKKDKKEKKQLERLAAMKRLETPSTRRKIGSLNLLSGGAKNSLQGIGVTDSEDISFIDRRLMRAIPENGLFVNAIRNGICMHHSGLNNVVRTSVEMLYRKRVLNVVFATGTLALGIHMPCKTSVIVGNSAYLNSLEYHQMAGRAGRRGYDTAGNVIFLGLNPRKQHSLLTAKLPDIKGNFPITVTFILRMLLLVSDVTEKGKQSDEATKKTVSRVMALLENSLMFTQNSDLKMKIKHFFSFSLQLLKMQEFINDAGAPLTWCGLATHLHYHEPGNLAFVYLLHNGIIRKICTEIDNDVDIQFTLMVVLCHLFTHVPLNTALFDPNKRFDNSKVILEPLPDFVKEALELYNKQVRFVFNQYFMNVAAQVSEPDNVLPLSSVKIQAKNAIDGDCTADNLHSKFMNLCVPKLMCSSFSALSGNGDDDLYSQNNLISNIRQTISTDVKVIPLLDLNIELNGYALDFYTHGVIESIRKDNGIKAGAEFTLIKDFLLLLKTIVVSLEEMEVIDENDVVFRHFKMLENKYTENYNKAFGSSHY